jgi:hypothetical protein
LTFTLSFVLIVLLLGFDFWTVKNVSGRRLVGLRWWSQMKEDGTEEWVFESRQVGTNTCELIEQIKSWIDKQPRYIAYTK